MIDANFEVSALGAVVFIVLAILLFAFFKALRYVLDHVPMSKARRGTVMRALPIVETLVGLLYVLSAIPLVFKDHPNYSPIVLSIMIAGVVWVSWFAIRDFITGIFLKAGKICRVGDHVRLDGVEGRVGNMGYRVIEVVTSSGDEVVVPYSRLSRQAISRLPVVEGLARHRFTVELPEGLSPLKAKEIAWSAALNDHWASLKRDPKIDILANGSLDVTIYALTPDYGPLMERSMRRKIIAD